MTAGRRECPARRLGLASIEWKHRLGVSTAASRLGAMGRGEAVDVYLQFEHGEELQSIAFKGRVRLRVDFNAIGPVVAVEPVDGAVVIEAEGEGLPEAG